MKVTSQMRSLTWVDLPAFFRSVAIGRRRSDLTRGLVAELPDPGWLQIAQIVTAFMRVTRASWRRPAPAAHRPARRIVTVALAKQSNGLSSLCFIRTGTDRIFRDRFLVLRKPILVEGTHGVPVSLLRVRGTITFYSAFVLIWPLSRA